MSDTDTQQEHLDLVETTAVFVHEAEEALHKQQAELASALRLAHAAGLSLRALEKVAGGISREKVRRIVGAQ